MKKVYLWGACLCTLWSLGGSQTLRVKADTSEQTEQSYQEQITQLEEDKQALERHQQGLKQQLIRAATVPSAAYAFNVKSQMQACEQRLDQKARELDQVKQDLAHFKRQQEARSHTTPQGSSKDATSPSIAFSAPSNASLPSSTFTPDFLHDAYPYGQCTWGAKALAPWAGNHWGNANQWAMSAQADGFPVGKIPKVGAIIVWTDSAYGHVAVVTDTREDGAIQILEANYGGSAAQADPRGIGNYRGWFHPTGAHCYIYNPNA